MLKINNYTDLKIDHIIIFSQETTFACCRENSQGRLRLFLVLKNGAVYSHNGHNERWEALGGDEAGNIRNHIEEGAREGVPVYRFNGTFHSATEQVISNQALNEGLNYRLGELKMVKKAVKKEGKMKRIVMFGLAIALILGLVLSAQAANPEASLNALKSSVRMDLLHYFYPPNSLKWGMLLSDITVEDKVVVSMSGGVIEPPTYILHVTFHGDQGDRHFRITMSNIATDAKGRIMGYTQTVKDLDHPEGRSFALTKTLERNETGQVTASTVNTSYKDKDDNTVATSDRTVSNRQYDEKKKLESYHEAGKTANGTTYDREITILERDEKGWTKKWRVQGRLNGVDMDEIREVLKRDEKGRLMKWQVTTATIGLVAGKTTVYEVERDAKGHITKETITYTQADGVDRVLVKSNVEYDAYGLQASYHIKVTKGEQVLSDYDLEILVRDEGNRLVSFREIGLKDGLEIDLTTTYLEWDEDGRHKEWQIEGTRNGKDYRSVQDILERDDEGRITKQTLETTIDGKTSYNGYWDYQYNAYGQMTSYKRKFVTAEGRIHWYQYNKGADGKWAPTTIDAPEADPFIAILGGELLPSNEPTPSQNAGQKSTNNIPIVGSMGGNNNKRDLIP